MVQSTRIMIGIMWRIVLFFLIPIIGFIFQEPFNSFLVNFLNYREDSSFFGFNFPFSEPAWMISTVFFGSIIYGSFGKKKDFIFIIIIFLLALWDFLESKNLSHSIYVTLFAALFIGNAIGFVLKLTKQRFFVKKV